MTNILNIVQYDALPWTNPFVGMLLSATLALSNAPVFVPLHEWEPRLGDRFIVDTNTNMGYLIHTTGTYTSFPVATGKKEYVSYIGRYYYAATPNWDWEVQDLEIKWDRTTFGPSGRFLRMFKDGEDYTAYGIHEYLHEDEMFALEERFGSMGCIIVRKEIMDVLEETYQKNEGVISVKTVAGLQ